MKNILKAFYKVYFKVPFIKKRTNYRRELIKLWLIKTKNKDLLYELSKLNDYEINKTFNSLKKVKNPCLN